LLGYVVETDLSERDPKMTKEAYGAFRELVTRFPDSKYAADSAERMRYLTNALAGYEVHVARYYYNRGAYVAAVNRAQATLVNYPKTPPNEDALVLLMESYDKLGMNELRDDTRRVLKETFPNGRYFTAAATRPWWKFWGKEQPPPLPLTPTSKPWWQIW
jgi:outer membrane protein assembly factor BamD